MTVAMISNAVDGQTPGGRVSLIDAFEWLADAPEDLFAGGPVDPPPQIREEL